MQLHPLVDIRREGGKGWNGKKDVYVMVMAIMLVTALWNKEAEHKDSTSSYLHKIPEFRNWKFWFRFFNRHNIFFQRFSDRILQNSGIGSRNSDYGPPSEVCSSGGIHNQVHESTTTIMASTFPQVANAMSWAVFFMMMSIVGLIILGWMSFSQYFAEIMGRNLFTGMMIHCRLRRRRWSLPLLLKSHLWRMCT